MKAAMRFSFAALVDYWRMRMLRIENQVAGRPHFAWSLRLERRVISYCLRRYADGPHSSPPTEATPLDVVGAARAKRLWLRAEAPPESVTPLVVKDAKPDAPQGDALVEEEPGNPVSIFAFAAAVLVLVGLIILIFILEPM